MTPQEIAKSSTILRCMVGSNLHGLNMPGQDDYDEMGVCIEPPEYVIGSRHFEQWVYRTRPEGVRSGPGDLDLTVYSLQKFCRLAVNGNPTILMPLFAPLDAVSVLSAAGERLRGLAPAFVSLRAGEAFLGYLTAQKQRLLGERGQMRVHRPELVEAHGYDCYAEDTEFLTGRGWLLYDEVLESDALATLNPLTSEVEFQAFTDRVAKPYEGPMIYLRHRYTRALVTPNHRMLANGSFVRADELPRCSVMHIAGEPRTNEYPIEDEMLMLVGAYVSEGCVVKRLNTGAASVLAIDQNAGGNLEPALAAIGARWPMRQFDNRRTIADRPLAKEVAESCGEGSYYKHLPSWAFQLSGRQAQILLDALMAGDGTKYQPGYEVYYTASRRLAGDVQALAIIAGKRSNVWGPFGVMYQVLIRSGDTQTKIYNYQNVERLEKWSGRIVCFTVPNETLVTRREGRVAFQGNTKYAMHMLRLGVQGVELLRTGSITLPMPEQERAEIMSVREGERELQFVTTWCGELEAELKDLLNGGSPLQARADMPAVDRFLVEEYMGWWLA